ncbi:MAG TPA: hypothetical protein VJC39_02155 [Candidatus Nanoarchaeia archaeon]|nr:hypothetical protein [Candidatus Nanoarchaeia archaeon]
MPLEVVDMFYGLAAVSTTIWARYYLSKRVRNSAIDVLQEALEERIDGIREKNIEEELAEEYRTLQWGVEYLAKLKQDKGSRSKKTEFNPIYAILQKYNLREFRDYDFENKEK